VEKATPFEASHALALSVPRLLDDVHGDVLARISVASFPAPQQRKVGVESELQRFRLVIERRDLSVATLSSLGVKRIEAHHEPLDRIVLRIDTRHASHCRHTSRAIASLMAHALISADRHSFIARGRGLFAW
jgi:hypothetical protein